MDNNINKIREEIDKILNNRENKYKEEYKGNNYIEIGLTIIDPVMYITRDKKGEIYASYIMDEVDVWVNNKQNGGVKRVKNMEILVSEVTELDVAKYYNNELSISKLLIQDKMYTSTIRNSEIIEIIEVSGENVHILKKIPKANIYRKDANF